MGTTLLSSIGFGISALVSLVVAIILTRAYLKRKEKTVKYFAGFIWVRFAFFICLALAFPLYAWTKNLIASGIVLTMFWIFIWISLLFLSLLYCSFRDRELKNWYFGFLLIVVIVGAVLVGTNFTPATYFSETGVIFQAQSVFVTGILYPFPKLMALTLLMFLFFSEATKMTGRLRPRSFLLGFGFFMLATTIIVPSYLPQLWNGLYCCIGDILILAGVMTKPKEAE